MAEPFTPNMPCDKMMGMVPETLRNLPQAKRTLHPIQSFAGLRAEQFLSAQTIQDPLAPIAALAEADGWVLLLGVDHTVDTSIHYAEKLAGRKQFVRWALMRDRVVECPGFPGNSAGFNAIAPLSGPRYADGAGGRYNRAGYFIEAIVVKSNRYHKRRSPGLALSAR